MAINRFKDYEKTQSYKDVEQLPVGGYVMKILGAEVGQNSVGQFVKISADIIEGEYKDFFANEYRAQQSDDKKWHCNLLLNVPLDNGTVQDGWAKRRFKTIIEAIEESNPGYHFDWDEQKFKGKLIGGLFNLRQYKTDDEEIRTVTNFATITTVEAVRSGKYKLPKDKLLKEEPQATSNAPAGFMSIPADASDDDLPFN